MNTFNETRTLSPDHLAKVSHDFKTPLNIILSSAALLRLKTSSLSKTQPELQKYIHYIEHNCHRLLRMVNELLTHSQPEDAPLTLQTSRCDLVSFLEYTLEDLRLYSLHLDVELYFRNDFSGPCFMNLDRDHLERILMNLISNALKHTSPGGTILVLFSADEDFANISVIDNGTGIPRHLLPEIFEPYRTDNHPATETGTGLGLPIAKELVELHKGRITVNSAQGKGTCVHFSLSRHLPITTEFSAENPAETAGSSE